MIQASYKMNRELQHLHHKHLSKHQYITKT